MTRALMKSLVIETIKQRLTRSNLFLFSGRKDVLCQPAFIFLAMKRKKNALSMK